jgi:hypothetical protein
VKTFLVFLALAVRFALHRRPPGGGGGGPHKPPGGKPGGGTGKPSQTHGKIDASSGVSKAQDATGEVAQAGRPGGTPGKPGTPGTTVLGGHTKPSDQPDPNDQSRGRRTRIDPNDKDPVNQRAIRLENDGADDLARAGYDVEQNPPVGGTSNPNSHPDYRIEGEVFDCYSPSTGSSRNIWDYVREEKVEKGQSDRVIINLNDPGARADVDALRKQFHDWPMPGLKEVKVIDKGGKVIDLYP